MISGRVTWVTRHNWHIAGSHQWNWHDCARWANQLPSTEEGIWTDALIWKLSTTAELRELHNLNYFYLEILQGRNTKRKGSIRPWQKTWYWQPTLPSGFSSKPLKVKIPRSLSWVWLTLYDGQKDDDHKEEERDVKDDAVDLILISRWVFNLITNAPSSTDAHVHVEHVTLEDRDRDTREGHHPPWHSTDLRLSL